MLRIFRPGRSGDSDEQLLQRYVQTQEPRYLGFLYDRYVELVYGVALRYLRQEADAEDAVMAIYEELTQKVDRQEIANFRSWLYVVAKNHCLMRLRREQRHPIVSFDTEDVYFEPAEHPVIGEPSENGELDRLQDCLRTLNDQQKACIELFYLQGKSYKEVAALRSETLGQVRSNIQNGRRNLRKCMEEKPAGRSKEQDAGKGSFSAPEE